MKRSIISVLGNIIILGTAAGAFAQGSVNFQNYNFGATSLNAPVTFGLTANAGGVNAVAGQRVGKEFSADLLYSLDGGTTYSLLTAAQANDGTAYPTPFAFGLGNDGDSANFAGYFFGNSVTIPGYVSGPITFIVQAYAGPSFVGSVWGGQSAPFTMSSITVTGGTALPSDFSGMAPFQVILIPEPSAFALAGLGAAGLMAFRRKK